MASIFDMARRMFSIQQDPPQAYSRITRTPIYMQPGLRANGAKAAGIYHPDYNMMEVDPEYAQPGRGTIAHESAHAIWNNSNLKGMGGVMAPQVPPSQNSTMELYKYAPDPETRADEGLGFSIGDPSAQGYVNSAASKITDPNLRQQLLRLNANRMGVTNPPTRTMTRR